MSQNGWHRVDPADVPDDGRVRSVVVDGRTVALSRCGSRLGALENRCPHQGGPLGEGSIEKGLLRCPWHGYDYDPLTGKPPEGFSDGVAAYRVDERADGVYVQLPPLRAEVRTDHAELAALAVKHAIDGRGVAHLVLPDEVQVQPSAAVAARPDGRLSTRRIRPDDAALSDAAALVRDARRPVLIVGYGARSAADEVRVLAERLNAPVLTTFKAKGLVPDTHPLGAGVLGRSGTPVASWLMNESDLLIVIGASFSNHTGIAPYKPIVQIDDDHAAIGRFDAVTADVLGDAAITLTALTDALGEVKATDQRPDLAERWAIWRAEKAGRCLESKGQPVLMSGYLGSIGFGYPAAMGAWAAAPDRPIVAVTGDGGFGQYATELTTAVKYGIPIKHVLLNNHALGKISKEQLAEDYPVWHTSLHNPDWADYAQLCGATGIRVTNRDQLDEAMRALFASDGPALLCVEQDAELL